MDMSGLAALMKSKGKKVEDGPYKEAKMGMLDSLNGAMDSEMAGHLKGLKKPGAVVEIAAPDKEGLAQGLDAAKDVAGKMPGIEDLATGKMAGHELGDPSGDDAGINSVLGDLKDPEEVDALIKYLEIHKDKLMKQGAAPEMKPGM